ncbi:MAG: alpha-L-rhamnosidase C-terminal domain-containing protein [Mariniphaga sp.]|nr:alpha-L-rhamnosidase C-terminal domain-containing protein [Mariniphaga sp.]
MKRLLSLLFCSVILFAAATEQLPQNRIHPDILNKPWKAYWINHPTATFSEYGVFHLRKEFHLEEKPGEFIIHVSADNRYKLYVNGQFVCLGPASGDIMHWRFESIDIGPFLNQGENSIAALVWNFGGLKPIAQLSYKTAFILQGNTAKEELVNSNSTWKILESKAYSPVSGRVPGYFFATGPCDRVDAAQYPWGWNDTGYNDSSWLVPRQLSVGLSVNNGTHIDWGLEPRQIPLMERYDQQFARVRRTKNIEVTAAFLQGKESLTIDANQNVSFLLDQDELTTAYPELIVSKGQGSEIKLTYAEGLYDEKKEKGNRDEVDGKKIIGYSDYFLPDGGDNRKFIPLWFRTWRYVQLDIQTGDESLVIEKLTSEFTGYPFEENASFESDNAGLSRIWETGWRTARLCAGETYYDCPYYEQLQYVGDTRIQALISLYVSGDDRLMRKAIRSFDDSRFNEGLTSSRYPTNTLQVIPPYSLFWVDMIYDYWMHRDDPKFIREFFSGIEAVLGYFIQRIDTGTGMLGKTGYWNFVDGAEEWNRKEANQSGIPGGGLKGNSSILSLQLAYSCKHAAEIFRYFGQSEKATYYENIARRMTKAVKALCLDPANGYIADSPDKNEWSMHAQIFAVLTGVIPKEEQPEFVRRFRNDNRLIQPSLYFRFYLTRALQEAGLSDEFPETLHPWYGMLNMGLTTFPERPDGNRSDCHAWSSSPNYEFLALIAGIKPASPGFKTVIIKPHLGDLKRIKGKMPHPQGTITFSLERIGAYGLKGMIELPQGLSGEFVWKEHSISLTNRKDFHLP